jgi:hypothetical protein
VIYSELKSSIADFLNRQDLTSVIPTFIQLCEADLNRTVRHKSMLTRATATLDTHFTALPADFLEAKNIQLNTEPVTSLQYVTMEHADLLRQKYTTTGVPKYYALVGDTIEVVPLPAEDYTIELTYYKKIPSLSDSSTSNWLLSSHPDVYLYGSLMQAAPYLKDDERIAVWGPLYRQFISDLNFASDKAEVSGARLVMRSVW